MAHDPLRDKQAPDHSEHHDDLGRQHRYDSGGSIDLAVVRSLVASFRETGDDMRLDEAWALLTPAIESETHDPQTLIVAAVVAQSNHDFTHALRLIETALAVDSNNDEAWLLLASIHLVRGDTEPAATACGRLRRVPLLVLLTCKARVEVVSGDHSLALERLRNVLKVVDTRHFPVEMLAWSYSVAGDLAVAAGESQKAVDWYRRSLAHIERSQVRAALVDVLLSRGDDEDARQVLDAGGPTLPLVVRRLIVAKRLNRMNELASVRVKVEQEFEVWLSNEDWLHAREMARFYVDVVDRPNLARRLALINIKLQREPEDLRLEKRTRQAY